MGRPTHVVTVKVKDGDSPAAKVGVAWMNDQGWMSVKLNPCVSLTDRDDIYINIYPDKYRDRVPAPKPRSWSGADPDDYGPPPCEDEEVPF